MSQEKKLRKAEINVDGKMVPIPQYMLADAAIGKECIITRDLAWIGKHGQLEDKLLKDYNLEVRPLDQAIDIAKADGANTDYSEQHGKSKKRGMLWEANKRGPKSIIDDHLLVRIAELYHQRFFSDASRYPDLDKVIKQVIAEYASTSKIEHYSDDALLSRLRRKFKARMDDLLAAVGSENEPERGPALAHTRTELDRLEKEGVAIDRSRLDPALCKCRADSQL